jgi:hypothetical protein
LLFARKADSLRFRECVDKLLLRERVFPSDPAAPAPAPAPVPAPAPAPLPAPPPPDWERESEGDDEDAVLPPLAEEARFLRRTKNAARTATTRRKTKIKIRIRRSGLSAVLASALLSAAGVGVVVLFAVFGVAVTVGD